MLKACVVGAGMMGRVHVNSYQNVKGVKVTAVCDLSPDRAKPVAELCGAAVYANFDNMLENEPLDVVDICLPTFLHKEYALKAIRQKKHVFCEKPFASNIEEAKAMIDAAQENNVKLSVGQVVRFFPAYKRAAENVAAGKIGTPKLIRTTRTGAFPSTGMDNWYAEPQLSGGVLLDLVIHDFDWIHHHFGDVERVFARNLLSRGIRGMDHCMATLRLKNGMVAHVEGSWAYPPGSVFGSTFEIIGTRGQIEFDSRNAVPVKKHLLHQENVKVVNESPMFRWEEPYTMELQDFIDSILYGKKPAIDAKGAIKALEISLAALQSAETGEPVIIGGDRG